MVDSIPKLSRMPASITSRTGSLGRYTLGFIYGKVAFILKALIKFKLSLDCRLNKRRKSTPSISEREKVGYIPCGLARYETGLGEIYNFLPSLVIVETITIIGTFMEY